MSEVLSAEEIRAQSVAAMPAPLGELYSEIRDQVTWLHLKWKDFCGLYGAGSETVDLLNAAAPAFFHNLQRMMSEDVLLHVCRLTDPPKSAGKETLTILRLPGAIPDAVLAGCVQTLADKVKGKSAFARDWRNRRLAHTELPPLSGETAKPLPTASRQHVEDALAAIRETMNCIERHYLPSGVSYEASIQALGGVDALLWRLRKGIESERKGLSPTATRSLLEVRFSELDLDRMNELAQKNQQGLLSDAEREELEAYVKVGDVLSLLHLKVRKSLQR